MPNSTAATRKQCLAPQTMLWSPLESYKVLPFPPKLGTLFINRQQRTWMALPATQVRFPKKRNSNNNKDDNKKMPSYQNPWASGPPRQRPIRQLAQRRRLRLGRSAPPPRAPPAPCRRPTKPADDGKNPLLSPVDSEQPAATTTRPRRTRKKTPAGTKTVLFLFATCERARRPSCTGRPCFVMWF